MDIDYSFLDLSIELRAMIFNRISQKEILVLRCVCKQLKYQVDSEYNFDLSTTTIPIPIPTEILRRLAKMRIRSLALNHLIAIPLYETGFKEEPLFEYPTALHYLRIETKCIYFADYKLLLEECSEYLNKLVIYFNSRYNFFTEITPRISFINLTELELHDQRFDFILPDIFNRSPENDIYLNILKNIEPSCSLKRLTVKIKYAGIYHHKLAWVYIAALFELIDEQKDSLEEMTYSYQNPAAFFDFYTTAEEFSYLLPFHIGLFDQGPNLKRIHVDYSNSESPLPLINDIWKYLIQGQRQLEYIYLKDVGPLLDDSYLQEVMDNNSKTLDFIIIWFALVDVYKTLDMMVFHNCEKLKVLKLVEPHKIRRDSINFTLPDSLEHVKLHGLNVVTSEIKNYFRMETGLVEVEINGSAAAGTDPNKGLDGSTLQLILNQPKLLRLKIHEFKFNTAMEDGELGRILDDFNPFIPGVGYHLRRLSLIRQSIENPFKVNHGYY